MLSSNLGNLLALQTNSMHVLENRFTPGSLRPETLARLAGPVNILLIVLLAHALARLTLVLLPLPQPVIMQTTTAPTTTAPAANPTTVDYQAIADWHLFGTVDADQPAPTPVVQVTETRLNLKLVGVLYSENAEQTRALIAEGSTPERSFTLGDTLSGGVKVEQILRDKVILSRNGQLESLSMPVESDSNAPAGFYPPAVATTPDGSSDGSDSNFNQTVNAGAVAAQLREAASTRADALQDLAFANPYVESGQFLGFRLRPGRNRALLGQLGLRGGDIITEINGRPLNSPSQGLLLMEELLQADQISAKVLRNGVEIPFTFYLNQ